MRGSSGTISAHRQDARRGSVIVGRTDNSGQCDVPHLDAEVATLGIVGDYKLRAEVRIDRITKHGE